MRPEEKERLEQWKKETLSEITKNLAARSEAMRSQPLEVFNVVAGLYGRRASDGFMQAFGFTTEAEVHAMSNELKNAYAAFMVSTLNASLAVDHPYLVALVFSDKDPQFRMCVVDRKGIPGTHELLNRNLVPVIRMVGTTIAGKPDIRFWPVDVEHLNPRDNLEDLYKL